MLYTAGLRPDARQSLPADAHARPLEQRLDFVARDPCEITWNRMLDRARRDAPVQPLLQVAVEHPVNEARRKRIAGAETIHNFDLIRPRSQCLAIVVKHRG